MVNNLYLLVFVVCFYYATIMMLLPSCVNLIIGTDGSVASMVTYLSAITIAGWTICKYGLKNITNPWIVLFIGFMIFSSFHGPNIHVSSSFAPPDTGIYNFKPMFEVLLYFFMFLSVSSLPLLNKDYDKIFQALSWTGVISSVYVILQWCGIDQLYHVVDGTALSSLTRNPSLGGFLGQPVFVAALLVICLPFVYKHQMKLIPLILLAIILTGNRSAMIAVICLAGWLVSVKVGRREVYILTGSYIAILAVLTTIYCIRPSMVSLLDSSGRFGAWKAIIADFLHSHFPGIDHTYGLTGFGIGSFSTLFPFYNNSVFFQAHNEFLEVFYGLSFIGLFIFINMIIHVFKHLSDDTIFLSLIGITICALTNPVWHVPQLQFLTVFLIGLGYNKTIGVRS